MCVTCLGRVALGSESSCDWTAEGLGDGGGEQEGRQLWPHEGAQVFYSVPRELMEEYT